MNNIKAKKIALFILITGAIMISTGCGAGEANVDSSKLNVITTLFPQYDFVKEVGGDKVDVKLIIPPGVEPHAFDPTPRDMAYILKSDLFVYTSGLMEPWAEKMIRSQGIDVKKTLDMSKGVKMIGESSVDGKAVKPGSKDPHYWLDPENAKIMVGEIVDSLSGMDPKNAKLYESNGLKIIRQLTSLDEDIASMVSKARTKTVIYGGHSAFGYFAKRYGLDFHSPFLGFSPNAEPTPQNIIKITNLLKNDNIRYIYYEELLDPKVARAISDKTGAGLLLLHGAHNLSKQELDSGITYIEIMRGNMERLKKGLY